jgi:hydroxyacylglutathione hydrolase
MTAALQIHTIVSLPFQENTYVVWRGDRRDALVIDPGLDPEAILIYLEEQSLNVAAILDTHGHADHIAGNEAIKERFPNAPLIIGANEVALLTDPHLNMSAPFGFSIVSPPADRLVNEGDVLEFADIRLEVLEIPGHSPGHVVFVIRPLTPNPSPAEGRGENEPIVVFGGDVLFRGSVGRCDFAGGSMERLADGIRTKLYTLPDDSVVYPGHGPVTKVGHEKRTNPFVK